MKRTTILLSSLLVLAACEDHTEGVAAATSAPATATPAAATAPTTQRQTLTIDRAASTVGFTGAKVTASHDGSFSDFSGTIELDPASVTASSVRVQIQMASMSIEPAQLSEHLASPELLDFAQFPTSTFESTTITEGATAQVGDRPGTHTITGNLTMHGQTRAISFPAIVEVTDGAVTADSQFTVNRRDFGIVYPGMPDDLIADGVVIRFHVRAPRS